MKITKILAVLFALAGICAAGLGIYLGFTNMNAEPVLLSPPDDATHQITSMMDAVCAGDYASASTYIWGNPDLGADRDAADPVGVLFWDAFVESLSYELVGECYATDSGLVQNMTVTCLDVTSVTANLKDRSQTLLEKRVAEAKNTSEIYDENSQYREDFVMGVLFEAAEDALEEDAQQMTTEVTVNLTYQDGQWWILADNALLDAISGGILY